MASETNAPQRRRLTVLFSDLVNSTGLAEQVGDEELHEALNQFLSNCTTIIRAEEGYIARYMGDGVLAYFGYPNAHVESPSRAVIAALKIEAFVNSLETLGGAKMRVRSGIATGDVIVGQRIGSGAAEEVNVVGEAPNLAARLQVLAEPNQILVCERTCQTAREHIRFADLGSAPFKGFSKKHRVFAAMEALPPTGNADQGAWISGRLVGRQTELGELIKAYRSIFEKAGAMIGIVGEAGIGKSHLLRALKDRVGDAEAAWLNARASALFSRAPFSVAKQVVEFSKNGDFHISDSKNPLGNTGGFESRSFAVRQAEAMAHAFLQKHQGQQLVLTIEDLHWSDRESLDFLRLLSNICRAQPWLVICTSRMPLPASLKVEGQLAELHLGPLDEDETNELVTDTAGQMLADEVVEVIVGRSGGVPLFAKELTAWISDKNLHPRGLMPVNLADLLLARLDTSVVPQKVLQACAVLNGHCTFDILAAVTGETLANIAALADTLQENEVLHSFGSGDVRKIAFAHVLLRDTAYGTLLRNSREALHKRTALAMSSGAVGDYPSKVIAFHWLRGGEPERAADLLLSASESEFRAGNYLDAQASLELALQSIRDISASPARDSKELKIQIGLAKALQITAGYSAPGTLAATARAERLAERQGAFDRQFAQMTRRWMAASSAGQFLEADNISRRVLALALAQGQSKFLASAWMARLTSLCRIGNLDGAEEAFQNGSEHFLAPEFTRTHGAIPQTYGNAAIIALLRGRAADARARAAITLNAGRKSARPFDKGFARYMISMFATMQGMQHAAKRIAASALEVNRHHNFPQFIAPSEIVLGRAVAALDSPAAGAELIRSGLKKMKTAKSRVGLSMYMTWLAEAEFFCGDNEEALATVSSALKINPEERFYRPETLRFRGILLKSLNEKDASIADFEAAHQLATEQNAQWHLARVTPHLTGLGVWR